MTLHVEIRGEGRDLVLLHGWGLHGGMWGPWLERLAAHARLHLVDLPGHGRSPWHEEARDLAGLARAVLPVVPDGAVVLGWSLGGMVALELARRCPGHLGALVLVATTPRFLQAPDWQHGLRPEVLGWFAQGLAADFGRTVQDFLVLQVRGDERGHETLCALRRQLGDHGPPQPHALETGLRILEQADLRDALPGIALPALVISGENDRLTPVPAGRALAAALGSARFVSVERAGHAPFLSHPEPVLREITGFLERLPAPDPGRGGPVAPAATVAGR